MLPTSRNTTYAPSSPVLSEDLNDMQDAIIAGAHGVLSSVHWPTPFITGGWVPTISGNAIWLASAAGGANIAAIPLHNLVTGMRLTSLLIARFGDGAADFTAELYTQTSGGGAASLGSVVVTNPAAAWADSTLDCTDTLLTGDFSLALLLTSNAAGLRVGRIKAIYDRPL